MVSVKISKSTKSGKKYMAVFTRDNGRTKTTHFGSAGMDDYTKTKDKAQRKRYLDRHRKNENWNNYESAGSLSRYILWGNSTSLRENIKAYKSRFNLK
tara:strand:- start:112 stop:405 length:294 start_codon:yes stop_codon:yes gene_type:complete